MSDPTPDHLATVRAALDTLAAHVPTVEGAYGIAGLIALGNAAPALIAEVRRLRALVDEREGDMHARIRAGYDKTVADAWRAEVAKRDAEIARLRALVESQRRDYLDVCDAIAPETSGPADAAAKVRALRAKIADAKRLGMEACEFIHGAIANAPDPMSRDLDDRAAIAAGHNIATAELAAARAVPADVEAAIIAYRDAAQSFGMSALAAHDAAFGSSHVRKTLPSWLDKLQTELAKSNFGELGVIKRPARSIQRHRQSTFILGSVSSLFDTSASHNPVVRSV